MNHNAIAASNAVRAAHAAQVIENLEWIIGTDSPEHVAHRLGYGNARNLERQLRRWGRNDLANRIARESVAA
jgi:hypothetical protein